MAVPAAISRLWARLPPRLEALQLPSAPQAEISSARRGSGADWRRFTSGVPCRLVGPQGEPGHHLLHFAPGYRVPMHRPARDEECLMLAGDHPAARAGGVHRSLHSRRPRTRTADAGGALTTTEPAIIISPQRMCSAVVEGTGSDDFDPLPCFATGSKDAGVTEPEPQEPEDDDPVELELSADEPAEPPDPADTRRAEDHAAMALLVQRIVRQEEAALAELYRCLAARVFRQASRLVRDMGTAEEVVEDVFWQVWRQAPRFDAARGSVVGWVLQIARSRAVDALRARGRHPLFAALDMEDDAHMPMAEDADPHDLLDRTQRAAHVQSALAGLDPLRRQLVSLAFERGYSQTEIAEQTGLPLGTVKSHIRRALATMKLSLEGAWVTTSDRST